MAEDEPRLVPFEPSLPATGNGHHNGRHDAGRRRRAVVGRPLGVASVVFGFLAGSLAAAATIGRTQWLNLHLPQAGAWWRLLVPSAVAGLLAGLTRRDRRPVASALAGAVAALASLWGVYAMVRLNVPVLWTGRSPVRVVALDLARLALAAVPAGGAAAGLVARGKRRLRARSVARADG